VSTGAPATSGCAKLADACSRVADRTSTPREFLRQLGHEAAGVRRGPLWPVDAGRGGSNRIRGRGFRRHVDDGTEGQARHFAGIVAVTLGGTAGVEFTNGEAPGVRIRGRPPV